MQQISRNDAIYEHNSGFIQAPDDLVPLVGLPEAVLKARKILGTESSHEALEEAVVKEIVQRGACTTRLTRMERDIPILLGTVILLGDVVRLVGIPEGVKKLADKLC